uniref:Uncharacterized protein n=1 Tax=Amphimedon queenslandica TaxID=400682 RepID=A0A1X7TNQ9_AMPQE
MTGKMRKNEDEDKDDQVVLDCFVDADHDVLEGSADSDDNDGVADKHIWVNSINSGLINCTSNFYSFLRAVELELKCSLTPDTQHLGQPEQAALVISCKLPVVDAWRVLMENEDPSDDQEVVQTTITIQNLESGHQKLLKEIVP